MPGQIKVGGAWKNSVPWIKVGGSWKQAREAWVKVNGVWKQWYVSAVTYSFTGTTVTYTVPQNTTSITVDMAGAAGGGASNTVNSGGGRAGNRIQATLAVTPGQVLYLRVGGAGHGAIAQFLPGGAIGTVFQFPGGWPGGGGNGFTQLFEGQAKQVVGSGGGYSGIFSSSTINQANALVIAGGGGGGGGGSIGSASNPYVGQNGTVSGGGAAGGAGQSPNTATAGSALQGGSGDSNDISTTNGYGAGGGGAGYFGGGGGWGEDAPVGTTGFGGNGSSWAIASATNVIKTDFYQAGNGYITIYG
jgi:hypothetical protein